MLKRILFFSMVFLMQGPLSAQDFNFQQLDNPTGFSFDNYIGEIDGDAYLSFADNYFNRFLYSFDGDQLTELTAPDDLSYSYIAGQNEEDYYLVYNDAYYQTTIVRLDETGLNLLFVIDPNDFFSGFEFEKDGVAYFSVFDPLFNETLRYFDGSNLVQVTLPANFLYSDFLGELNGIVYVSLSDNLGNETIYGFDGSTFSPVNMPFVSPFVRNAAQTADGIYLGIYDDYFDQFLFYFDGTSLSSVPLPPGYINLDDYAGSINGRLFFGLADDYFDATLFELNSDNTWTEIPNPTGYQFLFPTGPLESEELLFPLYADDYFVYYMTVFDGTDLKLVLNPNGLEYSTYYTAYKDGHLVSYRDNYFNNRLNFYDNTSIIPVPSPSGFSFNTYAFQHGTKIYFEFVDSNFDGTLFSLNLNVAPLSADNTVSTERESPYTFKVNDFTFSDEDVDDTFQGIELVSLPTNGILHVFGAPVEEGQLIGVGDLDKLNYLPLDDGIGEPYDNFTFKVSDGFSLSPETYTMYINVNPTVGIEETALASKLKIFPNPAKDFVTINLKDYESANPLRMTLIGSNGQVVESKIIRDNQEILNLENQAAGIYHLVFDNDVVTLTRGLIISK